MWIKPENDPIQEPPFVQPSPVAPEDEQPVGEPQISPSDTDFSHSTSAIDGICPSISSPLSTLRISSVTNVTNSCISSSEGSQNDIVQTTLSSSASQVPVAVETVPYRLEDPSSLNPVADSLQDMQPNPSDTLHDSSTRWNFSFGCLDDLLPHDDPARSSYIQYKCTKLRYPLPLAAAMARLYTPSQIPPLKSSSRCAAKAADNNGTLLSRGRSRDQGFLEIDDSHFTLSNSNTKSLPSAPSNEISGGEVPASSKPQTKAQLRHSQTRRETRHTTSDVNDTSTTTTESPKELTECLPVVAPRPEQNRPSLTTSKPRSIEEQRRSLRVSGLGKRAHTKVMVRLDSEISKSQCATRSRKSPVRSRCSPPPCDQESVPSPESEEESADSLTVSPPQPSQRILLLRAKLCVRNQRQMRFKHVDAVQAAEKMALQLLSSHHIVPADDGLGVHIPHVVVLREVPESQPPHGPCYMFGDVVRLLCRLFVSSPRNLTQDLLTQCATAYRTVDPRFVRLQTEHAYVSLNVHQFVQPFELAIVPCPAFSSLSDALKVAIRRIPMSRALVDCVSLDQMLRICRLLCRRKPTSKLMCGLPRDNLDACRIVYRAMQNLVQRLRPRMLHVQFEPFDLNHAALSGMNARSSDSAIPADLVRYLSPFWWRVLSAVLPGPNEIIGLSMLTRSFLLVYRHLFQSTDPRSDDQPQFICFYHRLSDLHRDLALCLRHLRDAYASLIAAGSCLSARVCLSRIPAIGTDPMSLKLEQGRARLFASATAARENVIRILREEIIPYLRTLVTACEDCTEVLHTILFDKQLMGSFLTGPWRRPDRECEQVGLMIKQGVAALRLHCHAQTETASPTQHSNSNTPESFHRIAVQMKSLLEKQVIDFLVPFRTSLHTILNGSRSSLLAIDNSWLPAFARVDGDCVELDRRASFDVQLLTSRLQSQLDLFEAWIRQQHNVSVPALFKKMTFIESHLLKTVSHRASVDFTGKLFNNLRIPYGSKNKLDDTSVPNILHDSVFVPKWPPEIPPQPSLANADRTNSLSSEEQASAPPPPSDPSLPIIIMRRASTSSVYTIPPKDKTRSDNQPICVSKRATWFVVPPQHRTKPCQVPEESPHVVDTNNVASSSEYSFPVDIAPANLGPGNAAAKRVCVRLSSEQFSSAEQSEMVEQQSAGILSHETTVPSATAMDRRRLGRLKRRLKISHSLCARNRPIPQDRHSDISPLNMSSSSSGRSSPRLQVDETEGSCQNEFRQTEGETAFTSPSSAIVDEHIQIIAESHEEEASQKGKINMEYQGNPIDPGSSNSSTSFSHAAALSGVSLTHESLQPTSNAVSPVSGLPSPTVPGSLAMNLHESNPSGSTIHDGFSTVADNKSSEFDSLMTRDEQESFHQCRIPNPANAIESESFRPSSKDSPYRSFSPHMVDNQATDTTREIVTHSGTTEQPPTLAGSTGHVFSVDAPSSCGVDNACPLPPQASPTPSDSHPPSPVPVNVHHSSESQSDAVEIVTPPIDVSSAPVTAKSPQSSRIGMLLEQVTAELSELAPWFDRCGQSTCSAPGPITAAVLGQPPPDLPMPQIDLTSDDI